MAHSEVEPHLIEDHYPLQSHIGFKMTGWDRDYARFELPLEPFLMNRYGIPHGGVYAVLLDTVMGYCGCYTGDPKEKTLAMTLSMNTNFLSRPTGEFLIGEASRIGGGKRTFFAEGTIHDENGTLVATGSGTFRYRSA
ncbi:MAG: PaaI family thioesterase [Litoreibacter sp.]|nr:PaaI family thioesterase [Litoreibacter sp.]